MSTQVQFRRGTTTQNNAFTGAAGEISVDTDLKTIRLHDGTTAGGGATMLNNISSQTALNKTFSTGSAWQGNAVGLAYGGTGSSLTATAGAVAYSGASGLALSAAGTSGQILTSGGSGAPTWVAASSISAGTSTLATTATNIAGGSAGQLVIQTDTNLSTFITAGAAGTFLQSAGAGYAPTWAAGQVIIGSTAVALDSTITSFSGLANLIMGNGSYGGGSISALGITGSGPWTVTVTGITSTTGLSAGQQIVAAAGTGSLYNSATNVVVASVVSSTSITVTVTGGTTPTAGTITGITVLGYLQVPVGTTAQRSWAPAVGMIRYNSDQVSFEGYSSGAWSSLGGVSSVNKYTYIRAETSAGAANGDLDFFAQNAGVTAAQQVGQWNRTNLKDYTGTLVGTQTTQSVFDTTATTVNAFGAATTLTLGNATSATLTLRPGTVVGSNTTQTLYNTVATTVNAFGAATAITLGNATSATLTLNPGTIVGANTTQNVFNTVATTGNLFGAATAVSIGASTGTTTINNNASVTGTLGVTGATTLSSTLAVNGAALTTTQTTFNLLNATATTLNIGGAATSVNIGASTGTLTLANPTITATNATSLALNGASPAITTTSTTASVFNSNVTTLNIGQAATVVSLGATSGTTTIRNDLTVSGNLTINGTTTTVTSSNAAYADSLIEVHYSNGGTLLSDDGKDVGFRFHYFKTTDKNAALILGNDSSQMEFYVNGTETAGVFSGTYGVFKGAGFNYTGSTSGTTLLQASATASGTLTLPAATDTLIGKATTDTLTNKTFNTAGTGNSFSINSNAITGYTGTGAVVALSASPTFTGTVNAAIIAATGDITSPNFYSVSDERLKSNIQDSSYGLAEVMKLRSVQYDMDGRHEVGLLAQNVEEHMSEFVTTDADGIKKLDYSKMVSVLVKTIQQQQEQIDILKSKLG